jgi:predicted RNA-binding Zn ribbon-like protein
VFDANLLCLDFVNTRPLRDGEPVDLIDTPPGLAAWIAAAAKIHDLTLEERRRARDSALPVDAGGLARALRLRDAVRAIADAALAGEPPAASAVADVNESAAAPASVRAVREEGGFRIETRLPGDAATAVLGEVARSAIHLLVDLDPNRVGRCDDEECVLYFYDVTRNRSRRWCSMERCGNRAKVAAHYWRTRREEGA